MKNQDIVKIDGVGSECLPGIIPAKETGVKKRSTRLTPKQERFCKVYLETGNATLAYKTACDADQMTSKTVNETACRLMKQANISPRINGFHEMVINAVSWKRQDSPRILSEIATDLNGTTSRRERIAAVKELNAMCGFNAPVRSQMVGADGSPLAIAVTVTFVAPGGVGSSGQ
jgi:hypothetical protein